MGVATSTMRSTRVGSASPTQDIFDTSTSSTRVGSASLACSPDAVLGAVTTVTPTTSAGFTLADGEVNRSVHTSCGGGGSGDGGRGGGSCSDNNRGSNNSDSNVSSYASASCAKCSQLEGDDKEFGEAGGGGEGGGVDSPPCGPCGSYRGDISDNFLSVINRARGIRSDESNIFGACS